MTNLLLELIIVCNIVVIVVYVLLGRKLYRLSYIGNGSIRNMAYERFLLAAMFFWNIFRAGFGLDYFLENLSLSEYLFYREVLLYFRFLIGAILVFVVYRMLEGMLSK